MSLRFRFRRLAAQARRRGFPDGPGCPACRDRRGRIVMVTAREQADGTVVYGPEAPLPCPACGGVPEQIIELVEVVVDSPVSAVRP